MIEAISQTLLNQWGNCQEQTRRRWIEGEIIPPGIAAKIGTGLHKGAEVNHRAKMISGVDEPMSVIQDAARDGYVEALKDGVFFAPDEVPGAKKAIAEGVDVTVGLAKTYRESLAPQVAPVLVEETIFLQHDALPIPFRGIVDVVADGGWWLDLKTSAKKWSEGRADEEIQATLYNELVRERTGSYPKRLTYEVFTKTKFEHHTYETTRTPEDFEALVLRAQMMLRSIEAGVFYPAQPGAWLCSQRWCGYWWTCPYIPAHRKILPKRSV